MFSKSIKQNQEEDYRWIIIGILISSIICCYISLQCLLPWLIKKLFRRTTNNVSSLKNDKTKRKDNKRYRLQIDNHNNDDGDTNEIT